MAVKPGVDPQEELPERFSLVAGGAFHALLGRLGLLNNHRLPSRNAALGLALLAWLLPALVVIVQSLVDGAYSGWDYFRDLTVYARYLVAIFVMVWTEHLADGRIVLLTRYFRDAQLLKAIGRARFAGLVRRADRQANSYRVEVVILIAAFAWSIASTRYATAISTSSWEGMVTGAGLVRLSWAGEASAFFSNTLFLFLVLRWFWRFYIWAALLRRTASLRLQIMPLHPDRCGGLGFLAIFPGIFSGLVFALSCVIAASVHKALIVIPNADQGIWLLTALWLLIVVLVFLGPLIFFIRPLYTAREAALLEYGRLAHAHHLEFHSKWIGGGHEEELLGSPDPSSVSDLNASVQTVHEMRSFPIDRPALVLLLASAGIPLLIAAALQVPLAELLKLILGVLL